MDPRDILELVAEYGYRKTQYTIASIRSGEPEGALFLRAQYAFEDVKDALDGKEVPLPKRD